MNVNIISNDAELTQQVIEALKTCFDPEIPVDIWELGLIYEININDEKEVNLLMTLTSPNCPVAESLPADVADKVRMVKEVKSCDVKITFEPPWMKEMMSEIAQLELGFM
ncbi:SUF system Fe-S cluster assembly protein [soil metagenome]